MITVLLIGHDYQYEVKELLKLFYTVEDIEIIQPLQKSFHETMIQTAKNTIISKFLTEENRGTVITEGNFRGKKQKIETSFLLENNILDTRKKAKQAIKSSMFQLLTKEKDKNLPWGFLTGIRPTKIVHELMEKDLSDEEILGVLTEEYFIVEEKALLLLGIAKTEHQYVYPIDENKVSLYISIPFCPTRCVYCSFPSNPLNKFEEYVPQYVEALCQEIVGVGEMLSKMGKEVETLYIGGGTPTTLKVEEFFQLFHTIFASFDLKNLKEFTVEAGRPDTIDKKKLVFLKNSGVTRISINPQTMNDCTLQKIGRKHSAKEIVEAYQLAKDVGFENINMDIIIGLPGENPDMVCHTMEEIKKLSPNNLTVHTLAIKNASKLKEDQYHTKIEEDHIMKMLEITAEYAREMGLKPYYMYRQKHMVGNLENIGYAKPGYECIYNIQIMEEKQTIIAMGAGAVSKIVFPKENRLERVPNVKNLEQYLNRAEEMIERKKKPLN
ncbi:coproporphyrinogen dehydrogenase HemZ [Natronincola ferrireducens]|uniref:Oxygen-independent coproporphyrinogen-3 oxidase n=1 Tax=Natronincola ferrireducens TaxID=393762 RepID=A0A1G9CW54_9FIRM|nr:coproporphyrinogen dehydrogenase HemZ [Natronincola ferrireducens]SDK55853.1 oxygen-independent coproporphyrinogen-3 oxidase [Natronincola ferrireducens]